MEITTEQIKQLRDATGISVMQCRKALEEAKGDIEKALAILKKKGADAASKKSDRTLGAGRIAAYVHSSGTVGAMVELASETDFVSKNNDFYTLAYDIAMHVAASKPQFVKLDDVPQIEKDKMTEIFKEEVKDKPANMHEKIIAGKLDSFLKERTLLEQSFIKNPDLTIRGLIENAIQKFGEKIEVVRFTRYGALEA